MTVRQWTETSRSITIHASHKTVVRKECLLKFHGCHDIFGNFVTTAYLQCVSVLRREKTTKGRANNRGTMAGQAASAITVYIVQTNARSLTDSKHETSHPCSLVFLSACTLLSAFRNEGGPCSSSEFYRVNYVIGLTGTLDRISVSTTRELWIERY